MKQDVIHAAEAWVRNKTHAEGFQLHDDWFTWEYEGIEYDISIFTDFHTGKTGAVIYPLVNNGRADTLKGVRIL